MDLIERYILKIAFGAFMATLVGLTGTIWITQALRELDLLTGKGQTLLMFLTVTGLSLPTLLTVISPVALFIAVVYTLNKLNGDSELIVMSAAGMAPRRLLRPFLALAGGVALMVAVMTLYVMPASFQELRDLITRIRGDFIANIVKEGQFTTLENGITFHYRERSGSGALLGILMQDRRDPERPVVYLAERGQALDIGGQSYLVLEKGSVHRQPRGGTDSSIVAFERYAVDLAAFNQEGGEPIYKPRERSTTQLLFPDAGEGYYQLQAGRFRAELHERLSGWLYPLAMMLIAFAALGDPRTTRQGRGAAVATAVVAVVGLRILGFAASGAAVRGAGGVAAVYAAPLGAIAVSLLLIFYGPWARARASAAAAILAGALPARLRLGKA
jgi:lipopolysaccharide export system permease protein